MTSEFSSIEVTNYVRVAAPDSDPTSLVRNQEFSEAIDPLQAAVHAAAAVQAGSSWASGSLYYSGLSSDVDQNQLASDLANAISSNIWFVTASATGNVVTITWNNAGTFNNVGGESYYFYSENEGYGYPAEISDTVVIPGTASSISGLYEIVDMTNLTNLNGYAVLLSAIPAPNLSNPGPIGASNPSTGNFTSLTVGTSG